MACHRFLFFLMPFDVYFFVLLPQINSGSLFYPLKTTVDSCLCIHSGSCSELGGSRYIRFLTILVWSEYTG